MFRLVNYSTSRTVGLNYGLRCCRLFSSVPTKMETQKFKIKFCTGNANKLKEFQEITKEVFECESIKIECRQRS